MYLYKDKLYNRTLNATGIYAIVNTVNDKFYIGSGIGEAGLKARKNCHLSQLQRGVHENDYLQASWNKYGEDAFEFWVLGICSKEDGLRYEQLFINLLNPHYNLCKNVRKEYYEFKHKEEFFEKVGKSFELVSPEGEIVTGKNLKDYCRKNDLNYGSLLNICSGATRFNFEGWTANKKDHEELKKYGFIKEDRKPEPKVLVDPEGNEHIVYSAAKLAKEKGLDFRKINKVLNGEVRNSKGWQLKRTKQELDKLEEDLGKPYFFISPEGQMFSGKNIKKFATEKGLCISGMTNLHCGRQKESYGWTTTFENHLKFKYYGSCTEHQVKKPTKLKNIKTGEKATVFGAKKFCEKYGTERSGISNLISGKIKQHKGWILDV